MLRGIERSLRDIERYYNNDSKLSLLGGPHILNDVGVFLWIFSKSREFYHKEMIVGPSFSILNIKCSYICHTF